MLLEHLVTWENLDSRSAELVRPNLGVVRDSTHLLDLNRSHNIAFMEQGVEKNYSVGQKFL